MVQRQPVVRERHFEFPIEREKRFQQILFIQREPALEQPLRGIVVREKDIVNVNPDAGSQRWQHFEKLVTDVTPKLHRMTRIDEQNVICFKTGKELDVELFNGFLNQLDFETQAIQPLG